MAANHKLTEVLKGRKINGTQNQGGKLIVNFDDGSTMTIKTVGNSNSASTGGAIESVRQEGTTLNLDFEGGAILEIPLAEATSSVMVRDKNHTMEYAD